MQWANGRRGVVLQRIEKVLLRTQWERKASSDRVRLDMVSNENTFPELFIVLRWHRFMQIRNQHVSSVQFSSVAQSCPTPCDPMSCSTPGLPVHHHLPESTQTHVHQIGDAIQPSYPLSSASPHALNLSQHHSLFKWVSSLHQVAKVLEFQLQHQSFQWTPRTDFL